MLQSIATAAVLLLLLLGLFFLFYIIINRLLFRTGKDEFYTIVLGKSGDKDLCDKVYGAFLQANTLNFSRRKPIYVVDCGLTERERELCEDAIFPDSGIIFLHGESLSDDEYIVISLDKES